MDLHAGMTRIFDGLWFAIEWKPQDLWVGAFWKTSRISYHVDGRGWCSMETDLWVCLLPCVPIHFTWARGPYTNLITVEQYADAGEE